MEVTDIRVKLVPNRDDKLKAFCTITFDNCFVVRDLKIIGGTRGLFVAMPSRKLTDLCPSCTTKNHLRARYCNECGSRLVRDRAERNATGRAKLYADIAHPIHGDCREELQRRVLLAYQQELQRASQPGYQPPSDEFLDMLDETADLEEAPRDASPAPAPPDEPDKPNHSFGEGLFP